MSCARRPQGRLRLGGPFLADLNRGRSLGNPRAGRHRPHLRDGDRRAGRSRGRGGRQPRPRAGPRLQRRARLHERRGGHLPGAGPQRIGRRRLRRHAPSRSPGARGAGAAARQGGALREAALRERRGGPPPLRHCPRARAAAAGGDVDPVPAGDPTGRGVDRKRSHRRAEPGDLFLRLPHAVPPGESALRSRTGRRQPARRGLLHALAGVARLRRAADRPVGVGFRPAAAERGRGPAPHRRRA